MTADPARSAGQPARGVLSFGYFDQPPAAVKRFFAQAKKSDSRKARKLLLLLLKLLLLPLKKRFHPKNAWSRLKPLLHRRTSFRHQSALPRSEPKQQRNHLKAPPPDTTPTP
ncbi:hypothetical protein [Xanthomonas sp. 3498]|uniref:hypothetical protein n=1 Tax=Xanthomonas sp. 3498 TaxID=2663863 RepID=UPI001620028D|nr:hypothetical protein [Xanthomonas sp. 3498]MBB5876124.1 hypothetical protein [Xanthomonas sp. 3498]